MATDKSTIVRTDGRPWWGRALGTLAPELTGRLAHALFFRTPPPQTSPRLQKVLGTGRTFTVTRGRRQVAAWTWGRGPAVYLLHGWGGRGGQLGAFVPALVEAGFSAVAFDAPGHGATGGRRSSAPEFADALAAVVAAHAPAHAIVAHSLGAVGAALSLDRGLTARAAVFVAPAAGPEPYLRLFADALGLPPAAVLAMRRHTERRLGIRFEQLEVCRMAGRLSVPLLVVHDQEDREVSWREGAAIARAWPGARLVTTAGLGHRRILWDAKVVQQVVGFVAGETGDEREGGG